MTILGLFGNFGFVWILNFGIYFDGYFRLRIW
jgi:hypothetical protein